MPRSIRRTALAGASAALLLLAPAAPIVRASDPPERLQNGGRPATPDATAGRSTNVAAVVEWRSGGTQRLEEMSETVLMEAAAALRGRHAVAVFRRDHAIGELRGAAPVAGAPGLQIGAPLGGRAAFVCLDRAADPRASVAALAYLGPIDVQRKQHPSIAAADFPTHAVIAPGADPRVALLVLFHADVTPAERFIAAAAAGAEVVSALELIPTLVLHLPASAVSKVVADDRVQWVEPPLPALTALNAENRGRVQADAAQVAPSALDGAGVVAFVYDVGRAQPAHPDFAGRLIALDSSGVLDHATHVAGTAAGDGSASFGVQRGMAPAATILSGGYEFDPSAGVLLYTNPGDVEADYTAALAHPQYSPDVANNSIGSNIETNFYPCSIQGDYGITDQLIDGIAAGGFGRRLPMVWAGGNERQASRCDVEGFGDYYSIAPPAGSKNPLVVGAVHVDDDSMTTFSSWGPCDDGRLKPDFVAPGCQTFGDLGVTSASVNGGYGVRCGTSMSAPTVAGMIALLIQEHRRIEPDAPTPDGAAFKALLAHTAVDLGEPGPDYRFGYGSVRLTPALAVLRERRLHQGEVGSGQVWSTTIASIGGAPLSVTLAWDDPPGTPNVSPALVNRLDLLITGPGGSTHHPWTLNPAAPAAPAVRNVPDTRNNLKQVRIDVPAAGLYNVTVTGTSVPIGPQRFALVATPAAARCTSKGAMWTSPAILGDDGIITIEVTDCDLNSSALAVDEVTVQVASLADPVGVALTLSETGANTGVFRGAALPTTEPAPGAILVGVSDLVTITYVDADDGAGGLNIPRVRTVAIDLLDPAISNVRVEQVTATAAEIRFETSEPANGLATLGLTCGSVAVLGREAGLVTAHRVFVTGLSADTTYQFRVHATDAAGNGTTGLPAGGGCFSLRTSAPVDYFTEIFQSDDNDLGGRSVLFSPDGSSNTYRACRSTIGALPTSPAGGTPLTLANDGSVMLSPASGRSVLLYGIAYEAFWVNANGTITLDGPDAEPRESTFAHFARPSIAGLWDNFDPALGGAVSWRELSDRIAVTWDDVPDFADSSDSTFQIEMYFDGRIRLSWLEVGVFDGLTGLSRGGGRPADFAESDMSAYPLCGGARPPAASDLRREAPTQTAVRVRLPASDDGAGPLALRIVQAPPGDLRNDADDQPITAANVPYPLAPGDDTVRYFAQSAAEAGVEFTFVAHDGGNPPDGGDSNVARVTLLLQTPIDPPFHDDFEATDFDTARWAASGGATIDGLGIGPPSPPFSARLNGDPRGGDVLTTRMVNLRAAAGATVEYHWQRRGGGESPDPGDDLVIYYHADDGVWRELARHPGAGADMTTFAAATHSLPSDALHPAFRLRIASHANEVGPVDDWFIDNVRVLATPLPPVSGDVDCDGALTNFDIAAFVLALVDPAQYAADFPRCDPRRADFDADGALTNFDVDPFVACLLELGCDE
ncbi:MAG: S8 family serine peptidase [Phycisphaerales bacterium]|nr:S8 family serine peptidase [Phycisphaerales bacterium]